jgi:transcriptional regulator with PAS, ATPase and Fis domain
MEAVISQVQNIAPLPVSVLISGENGTGKEQIAKILHKKSEQHQGPFVAINCSAIPENLVESELFGYEKGAFTGAVKAHPGKFEQAEGGTLFLDEIGELPMVMQPKLLRAIQEKEGQRLGSHKSSHYNFRLICATNRDLKAEVDAGRFREDLYYRLFAVHLDLPPLRSRPEDIIALSHQFMTDVALQFNRSPKTLPSTLLEVFMGYSWPGNVRQLRREIERVLALCPEDEPLHVRFCSPELQNVIACSAPKANNSETFPFENLNLPLQVDNLERNLITEALQQCQGNKQKAAALLGLSRPGLYKKMTRLNIYQIEFP